MSIADEIIGQAPAQVEKTSDLSMKAAKGAAGTVKGICLLLGKGVDFTETNVMKAVKYAAFKKTGDIKYSQNNIDISKLRASGHVYQVEGNILEEVMGNFDEQCKIYGVKYSAMKDARGVDQPDYKPSYMVFFEGRDSDTIQHVMQEAWKDYYKTHDVKIKNKSKDKDVKPEERDSVKAKLAFFRDRVTDRDAERGAVEKEHRHDDISR